MVWNMDTRNLGNFGNFAFGNNQRKSYSPFYGTVTEITPYEGMNRRNSGCSQLVTVEDEEGMVVQFIVSPNTYTVNAVTLYESLPVVMFYDRNAPTALIYPPRYRAEIVAENIPDVSIAAGYFDRNFTNTDQTLRLNVAPSTVVVTANNQNYTGSVGGRNLIVLYGQTTRSIPAQTTPDKIIVMCD